MTFTARLVGGQVRTSSESKQVERFAVGDIDGLAKHPSIRNRLRHALEARPTAYIDSRGAGLTATHLAACSFLGCTNEESPNDGASRFGPGSSPRAW